MSAPMTIHPIEAARQMARSQAFRASGGSMEHMARGGSPSQQSAPAQYGLVASDVPGRTDRHNMDLGSGSFVLPADVVAGLGEGNSLAGSSVIDKMLHSSPYGIQPVQPGKGVLPMRDRVFGRPAPMQNQRQTYHPDDLPSGDIPTDAVPSAKGGAHDAPHEDPNRVVNDDEGWHDKKVPVVVAGGEYIVDPRTVAHHPKLGGLSLGQHTMAERDAALTRGHRILDAFLLARRAQDIKTLKGLPGPAK